MSLDELLALLPEHLYPELAGRHEEVMAFVELYLDDKDASADEERPAWLVISPAPPRHEEMLSFRLARPEMNGESEGEILWYYAYLAEELPAEAKPQP